MRMCGKMGDTKQVRVDNWGIFFLQRLQTFFSKTDYCDMTLQFEGNVQLKVHRLVMNACTDYFKFLEQSCTIEDNVILMPSDLQADVIVPIVNFMYTGMLEFKLSMFDQLYKTAQLMNITILVKLLDCQRGSVGTKTQRKRHIEPPLQSPIVPASKKSSTRDLPAPLPGRKLPVWKRKVAQVMQTHPMSRIEQKWGAAVDPLSLPDSTPKPTRFDWPDEDLPSLSLMETSFEDISYTSKPLLTLGEDQKASTSFDDLKQLPSSSKSPMNRCRKNSQDQFDMEEMKSYVKEQKIRSDLSRRGDDPDHYEEMVDDDLRPLENNLKRKAGDKMKGGLVKKVRFETAGGDEIKTTISINAGGKGADFNHEKIVSEILKKYPHLVKNKNVKLKIMSSNKEGGDPSETRKFTIQTREVVQSTPKTIKTMPIEVRGAEGKAPWKCDRCVPDGAPLEFNLYYLYRKHMTDVHNEKFDSRLCKYCGHRCNRHNLLLYHLYTKHGMRPPPAYNFPKCDRCPYIALSENILARHRQRYRHTSNEIQCVECKLAFSSAPNLTSHMQITGHTGKTNKSNFDCQYCTKRYQSGVNLFSHVKLQHRNEAIRDGMVSIDEVDEVEELEDEDDQEEGESKDEYILPEIIDTGSTTKKVNILSNVKVQDQAQHEHTRRQLDPSSEAESLNNVASGIATSLGLVDIVVINDHQQLFIQQQPNAQQHAAYVSHGDEDDEHQPEFILPELTHTSTGTNCSEVKENAFGSADGVSVLSTSEMGSTDELVMVLTDHDYGDNQDDQISGENSNIVVLYSHPVDRDDQGEFITASQGNIMVNSQTGLIEFESDATAGNNRSMVINQQIESIEMIQREIASHSEIKQESNAAEEDNKENINRIDEIPMETNINDTQDVEEPSAIVASPPQEVDNQEAQTQEQEIHEADNNEKANEVEKEKELLPVAINQKDKTNDFLVESLRQGEELELTATTADSSTVDNTVDNGDDAMEIVEEEEKSREEQREETRQEVDKSRQVEPEHHATDSVQIETVEDKEPSQETEEQNNLNLESEESTNKNKDDKLENTAELGCEDKDNETTSKEQEGYSLLPQMTSEDEEYEINQIENIIDGDDSSNPSKNPDDCERDCEKQKQEVPPVLEEKTQQESKENDKEPEEPEQPRVILNQNNDDLSQSGVSTSHESEANGGVKDPEGDGNNDIYDGHSEDNNKLMKNAILDDWEDTDSQNSNEHGAGKIKDGAVTVNKLMDDWGEEDEEDDGRK